jgi:hypothetical protein
MSESGYYKCACPHCGQSIEYPAEGTGQTVPCPTCQMPFVLMPARPPESSGATVNSTTPVQEGSRARKTAIKKLSSLTRETIREKSSAGNTPLHLAAKNGHIDLIPSHLLSEELFMDRNREGNTPLHIAAMHGNLFQVPRQFLTKRSVTIPNSTWTTGSGYKAQGPTALYAAADWSMFLAWTNCRREKKIYIFSNSTELHLSVVTLSLHTLSVI